MVKILRENNKTFENFKKILIKREMIDSQLIKL